MSKLTVKVGNRFPARRFFAQLLALLMCWQIVMPAMPAMAAAPLSRRAAMPRAVCPSRALAIGPATTVADKAAAIANSSNDNSDKAANANSNADQQAANNAIAKAAAAAN